MSSTLTISNPLAEKCFKLATTLRKLVNDLEVSFWHQESSIASIFGHP